MGVKLTPEGDIEREMGVKLTPEGDIERERGEYWHYSQGSQGK